MAEAPAVIFVTQAVDEDDPVLGFTTGLIRALARRTTVAVIANQVGGRVPADLGAEVVSLGKEGGAPRWRMAARYETAVAARCRRLRPAVLFAHMCPPFLVRAAPVTKATGTPAILWYAHLSDTPGLRLAERLADAVATSLPTSYPRATPKVRPIGQAIDTDRFAVPSPVTAAVPLNLLALGRHSEQKDYPVMLRGVALARQQGVDARLRIEGPGIRDGLRELVAELGLDGVVALGDGVPPAEVPSLLDGATALVNATRAGATDKAVFEAMACGRPALASSPTFWDLLDGLPLDLRFAGGDPAALAGAVARLAAADEAALRKTGELARERVVAGHSVDHWADEVLNLAASLARRGSASRAALG